MSRRPAAVAAAFLALAAGCCTGRPTGPAEASPTLGSLAALAGPVGEDVVFMDVAVIERGPGDGYLDRELWATTDEQVVGFDRRARLDDNGFRVGQVGGILPTDFLAVLTSEKDCPGARHIRTRSGSTTVLTLGTLRDECAFDLAVDGRRQAVTLRQAQCGIGVTPERTADGRVRLAFTPQVAHAGGEGHAALAGTGWGLQTQAKPVEKYPPLGWELTLAANQYAVVGTRTERAGTLGQACFLTLPPDRPMQRLLVIRAGRMAAETGVAGPARRGTPLAFQAGRVTARGTSGQ
jgi:hypothetical protein